MAKAKKKKSAKKKSSPIKKANFSSKELALATRPVPLASSEESLSAYLASLREYPLLSPEREKSLAEHYQSTKDQRAAQLLVLSNLRLVVKIASDYIRSGFTLLDLIQEGNIGLLRAVQDYDPHRGVKFSSYASYWIKAYIRSFILKNWSLVKMGTTKAQRTLFYRLQKEKARLEAMGLEPEPKYLAERLDVKEKEITEMSQRLSGRDVSLSTPVGSEEDSGNSMLNMIEDESLGSDIRLAESEIQSEFSERLDNFEKSLSGKELVVFRERMRSDEPKTLQEIGTSYGITRERVRQIEARVLEKLREYMKKNAKFMEDLVIDV